MFEFLKFMGKQKDGNSEDGLLSGKKWKAGKREAIIGGTAVLAMFTMMAVSDFSPGSIIFDHKPNSKKEVKIGEFSGNEGPKEEILMREPGVTPPRVPGKRRTREEENMALPSLPNFGGNRNPSMPNFPQQSPPQRTAPEFDPAMVYAKHVSIANNIKNILNPSFEMKRLSDPPTSDKSSNRFIATYAISENENVLEQFELLSIIRTNRMTDIKTPKDAMDALMEESNDVNILDANDDYLIYDFTGDRGYQIGKILLDKNGIYVLGYVNLTTNDMPISMKQDWMEKIKML